jgi:hypothetical protein
MTNSLLTESFFISLFSDGFTRITSGPDEGGYYHELFLRGRPALCVHMRRVGVPTILPSGEIISGRDKRKMGKRKSGMAMDPDFYSMKPITMKNKKKKMNPLSNEEDSDEAKTSSTKSDSPPPGTESPKLTGGA